MIAGNEAVVGASYRPDFKHCDSRPITYNRFPFRLSGSGRHRFGCVIAGDGHERHYWPMVIPCQLTSSRYIFHGEQYTLTNLGSMLERLADVGERPIPVGGRLLVWVEDVVGVEDVFGFLKVPIDLFAVGALEPGTADGAVIVFAG